MSVQLYCAIEERLVITALSVKTPTDVSGDINVRRQWQERAVLGVQYFYCDRAVRVSNFSGAVFYK